MAKFVVVILMVCGRGGLAEQGPETSEESFFGVILVGGLRILCGCDRLLWFVEVGDRVILDGQIRRFGLFERYALEYVFERFSMRRFMKIRI